jgi:hypothetical protein
MIIDINECREETDLCQQECVNTNGSHHCACRSGYRLTLDEISCNGIYINYYVHADNMLYLQESIKS